MTASSRLGVFNDDYVGGMVFFTTHQFAVSGELAVEKVRCVASRLGRLVHIREFTASDREGDQPPNYRGTDMAVRCWHLMKRRHGFRDYWSRLTPDERAERLPKIGPRLLKDVDDIVEEYEIA